MAINNTYKDLRVKMKVSVMFLKLKRLKILVLGG